MWLRWRSWWCLLVVVVLVELVEMVAPPNCPVVRVPVVWPVPGRKVVDSQLQGCAAVHFGELYLKQNFLRAYRTEGEHIDHILGIGFGDHLCALGDILGGDVAGKHNGGTGRSDRDLLIGKDALFFLGSGADIHIHPQIKAAGALQFIPNQQGDFAAERPCTRICVGVTTMASATPGSVTETLFSRSVVLMSSDLPTITRNGAAPCDSVSEGAWAVAAGPCGAACDGAA